MPKSFHQKLKLLYLMEAFQKKSDEEHPLKVIDLISHLKSYGITAERKTIYDDIETLRLFGMDIVNRREQPSGFFLASRTFESAELKFLVDAVQSSRFITQKKSRQLIQKLEGLTSEHEARKLQRQVFANSCVKTRNESIYYNIDQIHGAISRNRQITFQYYEWTVYKEMRLKRNGDRYRVSPWELIWKNENYYLIGWDERNGIVKHYRVDRMIKTLIEKESRNGEEAFRDFDISKFAAQTFGMFGGREEAVRLVFENQFIGVVLDRFGRDVMIHRQDEKHFAIMIRVNVSGQFFGWLAGLGPGVVVTSPENVRKEYIDFLEKSLNNYKKSKEAE